jgi:GT2 family glycosyltransferase
MRVSRVGGEEIPLALVTVVIPNWNGREMLDTCLVALEAQTLRDFDTIVVDNGSDDGSVAWLGKSYPSVQVIENERNRGFAAPVNQGIQASDSPYVAVLNNDAEPSPGWLAELVLAAQSDPTVGMCASRMMFADRPATINSTGLCIDRAAIVWDRRGGEVEDGRESAPVEVFGPCAGAALYRREMLNQAGLFDEDFFAYLEDADLAWRARQQGWRCLYVPSAHALHRHSATGQEGSPFKSYHLGRNKVWMVVKNYPFRALWYVVPLLLLYDLAAALYALVFLRDAHALRGRLAGLTHAREMWHKRYRAQRTARGARPERLDLPWLEPLSSPWRVLRRYAHLERHRSGRN